MNLKPFFTFIILLFIAQVFGQPTPQKADSLLSVLSKTKDSDKRAALFTQLSVAFDTTDLERSFNYAKKALNEAEKKKTDTILSEAYNNLANVYEYRSLTDSSLIYHKKALALRLKTKNNIKIGDSYNNFGIAYDKLGDFPKSLDNYFKALRYYEKENDLEKQAMVLSNIGIVYKAEKEYEKALEYYQKANKIYYDLKYDFGIAVSEGNIGAVLIQLKKYNEAIEYSEKSKKRYEKIGYDRFVVYPVSNIAAANDSLKNYKKAEQLYLESAELFKKYENTYELANMMKSYASSLFKQKKYKESTDALISALGYAQKSDALLLETDIRKSLAKVYARTGNFSEAFRQMELYSKGKDSLFQEEKTKAVFELEKQYQTEKKEKEILKHKADEKKKSNTIRILAILLISLALIAILVYRTLKLKNKNQKQEYELKEAITKIDNQNKLQEQRLSISRDLHDNIGAQLTFIISSVDTLKDTFVLNDDKINNKLTSISSFTKDTIVELRDTIWAMNQSNIDFEEMRLRIMNFIEKAQNSHENVHFSFDIDPELKDRKFTSSEGMNIYRIIQESLNNALKYSEAENISVVVKKSDSGEIEISVSDDGKGFDKNEITPGNGLRNMKKRALEIGKDFMVSSEKGKGTKVFFVMN